ncbi:MAG TPA: S8 family serine peptidase [Thermoanaerobaculia bacterium]
MLTPVRALTDADRAELAAEGIEVGAPLSNGRHVVRIADDVVVSDSRIVSIEAMRPAQKVHASTYREFAKGRTMARVNVVFHKDVDFDAARASILAAGGVMDPFKVRFSPSQRVEVKVASSALEALAADDNVVAIAGVRNLRARSDNAVSAQTSHVTELYAAPYNLTGAGVTVSLFELAEGQASHVEFGGRLTVNATGGATSDKQHATHVAGTIGASGVRVDAKGMAPAVRIYQFCIQTPCGDDLSFLDDKDSKLEPLGVVADNNSWGFILGWNEEGGEQVWTDADIYYGAYDLYFTSPIDEISNDKDILFVHSAGNDADAPVFADEFSGHRHVNNDGDTDKTKLYCYSKNGSGTDCPATCTGGCETVKHHDTLPFDTIGVTAAAKNVITVGAVNQSGEIVNFSSRGPAKDGRIKPEVVARGANVLSSIPTNSYGRSSGTSMSTPVITGIAAMLTEQWRKTFAGATPKPVELKALIIASTQDLGNPGPDYTYGFGLANAKTAADLIIADGGAGTRIRTLGFPNGQGSTQEFRISVPSTQNVRVVLQWNDPAIIPSPTSDDEIADVALVNNLDLRVVGPDNTTYQPWVLDKAAPNANATKGVNTIDNTEMVDITNAAPGLYRVIVTGTKVTDGPQSAVVVTSVPVSVVAPCSDLQEPNNAVANAYGNLTGGSPITGAICTDGDLDFFKFLATETGPMSVTITAGDTPLRVTLTGTGISRTQDIAAGSTATLNADVNSVPNAITLRIEAIGTRGDAPTYTFTPAFGVDAGTRRRSARH